MDHARPVELHVSRKIISGVFPTKEVLKGLSCHFLYRAAETSITDSVPGWYSTLTNESLGTDLR